MTHSSNDQLPVEGIKSLRHALRSQIDLLGFVIEGEERSDYERSITEARKGLQCDYDKIVDSGSEDSEEEQRVERVRKMLSTGLTSLHGDVGDKKSASNDSTQTGNLIVLQPRQPELEECGGCADNFESTVLVEIECSCKYCKTCLIGLFESGLTDIKSFPPICCGLPLSVDTASEFLTSCMLSRFQDLQEEYISSNPIYCASSWCKSFIRSSEIDKETQVGTCGTCSRQTCGKCRCLQEDHLGVNELCPTDLKDDKINDLVTARQWQRCPRCYNIIEKNGGCNHVRYSLQILRKRPACGYLGH